MAGIEGGPTPEQMGINPEPTNQEVIQPDQPDFDVEELSESDQVGIEVQEQPHEDSAETGENENEKPDQPEISPEKQEGIDEVQREVAAGLGMLFDILPHTGKLNNDRVIKVLDEIKTVQNMGPAVKIEISDVIVRENLHTGQREDFVLKLLNLEYVALWIAIQGSHRSDQKRADTILEQIKNMNTPEVQ